MLSYVGGGMSKGEAARHQRSIRQGLDQTLESAHQKRLQEIDEELQRELAAIDKELEEQKAAQEREAERDLERMQREEAERLERMAREPETPPSEQAPAPPSSAVRGRKRSQTIAPSEKSGGDVLAERYRTQLDRIAKKHPDILELDAAQPMWKRSDQGAAFLAEVRQVAPSIPEKQVRHFWKTARKVAQVESLRRRNAQPPLIGPVRGTKRLAGPELSNSRATTRQLYRDLYNASQVQRRRAARTPAPSSSLAHAAPKAAHEMSQAEREAEIARIKRDNFAVLATNLASEGNVSPYQVYRMSERQRRMWQDNAQKRMALEAEMRLQVGELKRVLTELRSGGR